MVVPEGGRGAFEPPPWEREQFEALARKRAAEEESRRAEEEEWRRAAEENARRRAASETGAAGPAPEAASGTAPRPAEIDAMLVRLDAEERPSRGHVWWLMAATGAGSSVFGLVLVVAALLWLGRAHWEGAGRAEALVGWLGAAALGIAGAAFLAGGAWMAVKGLRQQGVL